MRRNSSNDHSVAIKDLFAVYRKRLKAPQGSVVKEVVVVVEEVTGISVGERHFSYTVASRTLVCKAPSVIRSELQFHQKDILTRLQKRLGERNAPTRII